MTSTPASLTAELTKGPVVLQVWTPGCSSCRALAPHVEMAATTSGVSVLDLRADADPHDLVGAFAVRSAPTLIGLHDGIEVTRLTGAQSAANVEALFAATLTGSGAVTNQVPAALLALRGAAGAGLAAAGFALSAIVLVAVGAGLIAWALADLARRALD